MTEEEQGSGKRAAQGENMVEVRLRFWTNNIAKGKGNIVPRHAWTSGVVRIQANESHGIVPRNPRPFQSLLDIGAVVEKVLIEHGVVLHQSRQMKKYLARKD